MEASRTFVGTVVCVDLVGYSKRSVAQQSEIKHVFNDLLVQVLKPVPPDDRIILDTGDGAAISYLGDPEESLALGLKLRDTLNDAAERLGGTEAGAGPVRIGIHLGPVRLGQDMNGRPKIIGDGINVAEKICEFARPGQVIVSHPFHDMVMRMSDKHRAIFHHEGARTDRNGRDHEIYSIVPAGTEVPFAPAPEPTSASATAPARGEGAWAALLRDRTKVGIVSVVLVAIIAGGLWLLAARMRSVAPVAAVETAKTPEPPQVEVVKMPPPARIEQPAPVVAAEPPPPKSPPLVEAKARAAKPAPVETKRAEPPASPSPRPVEPIEAPKVAPEPAPNTTATPVARAELNFPIAAVNRGIERGTVRARLSIDSAGRVKEVNVLWADPAHVFEREAIRSLAEWKFNAGADNRTYEVEIGFKR